MQQDHVAKIISQWNKERPDLDTAPMAIIGRLSRLSRYIERELETNFKKYDLQSGTFDLLASLRRNGKPYTLTPTQLQAEMMLSSGATTHRIDLLEKQGLIERSNDPNDRRGTLVRLTPKGKKLVDEVIHTHLGIENQLLSILNASQQKELSELLESLANGLRI